MSEVEVEGGESKLDKTKEVIKRNWKPFAVGVVLTGVTFIVTKRVVGPRYPFGSSFVGIEGTSSIINKAVLKDGGTLYKVFNIYAPGFKNQGLSWMVRCKETGALFRSQEYAAKVLGVSKGHMSMHLNGARSSVGGYHFERVGVGA